MLSNVCIKYLPTTATVLRFSFLSRRLKPQSMGVGITELCTSHKRRKKPVVYTGQRECYVYCHVSVSIHSSRPRPWASTPGSSHLLLRTASIQPPR
uniref:Uncharacterized protein n=1 Tax=Piliocolobus tephrosceles TaxID=591936 RepID=A0A8C9H560_9PRIM